MSDLRLFGEKGEWHVWRDWDGKHYARLQKLDDIKDALTEYHALWGTDVKCTQTHWVKVREDRGAEIWIPPLKDVKLTEKDLPLRLELKQIVGYDPKYHLAGIVDAALIALVRESDEEPFVTRSFPTLFLIMLQNFRFASYRFTYTVQEPLKMPPYKGNAFRGRFGYILRHITCVGTTRECEERCQFPDRMRLLQML